jgi:alkylation response protein AidB-like acyl-CoA dehydrogenase
MFWVDLKGPGVVVAPIRAADGHAEFAEMFFDDVVVSKDHLVGDENGGWDVAMYLLQFERGMYAWIRQAGLHTRLEHAVVDADPATLPAHAVALVGSAYLLLSGLRARTRETVMRLSAGEIFGPEISLDKRLLGMTEQAVADAVQALVWPACEIRDDNASAVRRQEWMYSRATTIFGGASEVQLDIIAERVLGLPRQRRL